MSALPSKKKTILRVKRKYSDIGASNFIVLSQQPKPKRQRTIPWNELTESFNNTCLTTTLTDHKKPSKIIPSFFDFDYEKPKETEKKHVFRLIGKDAFTRSFQQTKFHQNTSKQLKLKLLEERRTNREQYFNKMNHMKQHKTSIIQHDDLAEDDQAFVSIKNGANKKAKPMEMKLNRFKHKLLEKQKASRTTKIATQAQMNALRAKNKDKPSHSCVDWKDKDMVSLRNGDGEWINIRNVMEYECFNGYVPKYIDCKGVDITEMENESDTIEMMDACDDNVKQTDDEEYDYYELDEEADVDEVIAAIQARSKWIKEHETSAKSIENEDIIPTENNTSDLQCKLEKIKNKHLMKHFDAQYEAPTFGYQHKSKESEESRFGELTRNEFTDEWMHTNSSKLQTFYENLVNE
eukprot:246485_1